MYWFFNIPKAGPLSCVKSPIQKERIKIAIISILNVLGYNYLFLLKKQNQYAKKFNNTHILLHPILLHPISGTRGCKIPELNFFCDVEPSILKLKLKL